LIRLNFSIDSIELTAGANEFSSINKFEIISQRTYNPWAYSHIRFACLLAKDLVCAFCTIMVTPTFRIREIYPFSHLEVGPNLARMKGGVGKDDHGE